MSTIIIPHTLVRCCGSQCEADVCPLVGHGALAEPPRQPEAPSPPLPWRDWPPDRMERTPGSLSQDTEPMSKTVISYTGYFLNEYFN